MTYKKIKNCEYNFPVFVFTKKEHKRAGGREGFHKEDLGAGPETKNDHQRNDVPPVHDQLRHS